MLPVNREAGVCVPDPPHEAAWDWLAGAHRQRVLD